MRLKEIKCPNCKNAVQINLEDPMAYCPNCGHRIHATSIDAVTEKSVRRIKNVRKIIEESDKKHEGVEGYKTRKYAIIACIVILLLSLVFSAGSFVIDSVNISIAKMRAKENEAVVPYSYEDVIDVHRQYKEVAKKFKRNGFTNIELIPAGDITGLGLTTTSGIVIKVTIDGNSIFKKGDIYNKDAKVEIEYHSR